MVTLMQKAPTQYLFHNVGQGLFYSGKIYDFEFVYDCGSTRKQHLTDLVLDYKRTVQNSKVDLLVLSHLHDDHIAGLHALFCRKPKTSVERVILPYVSPIERLILAVGRPNMGHWYYAFLSDPVRFLIERGVRRITLLGGSEKNPAEKTSAEERANRDDEQSKGFINKLRDSVSLREAALANEPRLQEFPPYRLQYKSHDGGIVIDRGLFCWEFRFFNYSVDPKSLKSFADCIDGFVHGNNSSDVILDPLKREQLRGCYKSLHKSDFNNTSLLVYHGPISCRISNASFGNRAQLLTGDIDLKRHVSEICAHFGKSLSNVGHCLVPHHGSIRNWDKTILPYLSHNCNWVVSTGIANSSQPSLKILEDIRNFGQHCSTCNDESTVTYSV